MAPTVPLIRRLGLLGSPSSYRHQHRMDEQHRRYKVNGHITGSDRTQEVWALVEMDVKKTILIIPGGIYLITLCEKMDLLNEGEFVGTRTARSIQ